MPDARFLLVIALSTAQFMRIGCEGDAVRTTRKDYEILSISKYISAAKEQELSTKKVIFHCAFDSGWCGFENEKSEDDFNWTLTSKGTPSAGTGPDHDMTGKGSYIFIETSVPRRINEIAKLTSPVFPPMVYCLQFGFHAHGVNIGALAVYKTGVDKKRELVLRLEKKYGNKWQYVMATVVHTTSFQVEFNGVCGNGYRGDIALDNITLTQGKCEMAARNRTANECGAGFPGIKNAIPGYVWPWFVWLSSSGQSQQACPGIQVSRDWLLTMGDCVRRFTTSRVIAYTVNESRRKNVLKLVEGRSKSILEPVLLQVNSSAGATKITDKICLPLSIPLQQPVSNCYLLATVHGKRFVESRVTVLSAKECEHNLQANSTTNLHLTWQLCVQVKSFSSFQDSTHHGYVVCRDKVTNRWILEALGSFSKSEVKQNVLVLRRVSYDVYWIDNIIKAPTSTSTPPKRIATPTPPKERTINGFQIFETTHQECLTLTPDIQRFVYKPCNHVDTKQRFDWTPERQLVSRHTNSCVVSDGTHLQVLRVDRCLPRRRSQKWTCKGNTILNAFFRGYIASKSYDDSRFVRLRRDHDVVGHFVIFGTQDNLCTLRPTVKGVLKCDLKLHRCGFDGVDSAAQFMWTIPRSGTNDFSQFPQLTATDKFFRVEHRTRRGSPKAVLRSPWFRGQRCAEFRVFFRGSARDKLNIYRDGGGEGELMFQRNATGDQYWRSHRVTIVPSACEAYQVVFEVVFSSEFNTSKVAIRDITISPGACRLSHQFTLDDKCLAGWKLVNGQCLYFHDTKATWHEASAVCRIAGGQLATQTSAGALLPRGRPAWFGVRSCPTGGMYSVRGVPYTFKNVRLSRTPACLEARTPGSGEVVYTTRQCDSKLPFVCEKDPKTTSSTCGWRNDLVDSDRQWPWHVLIIVYERCVCAGTLVAPGYVVTNHVCLSRVWLHTVKLFIPSSRKMIRKVTKIIDHPNPGRKSAENDISIVIFEDSSEPAPSHHVACVNQLFRPQETDDDDENLLKGKKCVVLGWGTFKGSRRYCGPARYRVDEVEIVSKRECSEYYGGYMITERMICAKARNETNSKCLGDTGGPLVCNIAGAWTLVGVTSWGIGCSPTRKYGIFSNLASMKPWMDIISRENQ